mgnify:CR=1 FL=1
MSDELRAAAMALVRAVWRHKHDAAPCVHCQDLADSLCEAVTAEVEAVRIAKETKAFVAGNLLPLIAPGDHPMP